MVMIQKKFQDEDSGLQEHVVNIYRCAKVVKGGRRFSFSALVVVGDGDGKVGIGYGKANEVPPAVEKAKKIAARNMEPVSLEGTTIPHRVAGRFRASKVVLVPAGGGTGVIAGAAVRAVLEAAGVHDVLTKAYGSTSPKNLVKATMDGLRRLRSHETVRALRNVDVPMDEKRIARIKHGQEKKALLAAAEAAKDTRAPSTPGSPAQPQTEQPKPEQPEVAGPVADVVAPAPLPEAAPEAASSSQAPPAEEAADDARGRAD
jgi:small subunit ribosomal protein S5